MTQPTQPTQPSQHARPIADVSPPLKPMGGGMDGRLVIGQGSGLDFLDPFPALMHDDVPPHVMFPTHPHRGVEIISYCIGGALYHEDTLGNKGTLVQGGVERNLFGRGFAHSEQPVGGEPYRGFQLFIALNDADRTIDPSWQVLEPPEVPEVHAGDLTVRIIAGEFTSVRSPLTLRNPTLYLDVRLAPGATATVPVPEHYNGVAYILTGQGHFGSPPVEAAPHQRLVLGQGRDLHISAAPNAELRFVLISGQPIYGARA